MGEMAMVFHFNVHESALNKERLSFKFLQAIIGQIWKLVEEDQSLNSIKVSEFNTFLRLTNDVNTFSTIASKHMRSLFCYRPNNMDKNSLPCKQWKFQNQVYCQKWQDRYKVNLHAFSMFYQYNIKIKWYSIIITIYDITYQTI